MKRKSEEPEHIGKRLRVDEESEESSSSENSHLMSTQNEDSYEDSSIEETQQSSEGSHHSNSDDFDTVSEEEEYVLTDEEIECWSELERIIKEGTLVQLEEYFFSLSEEVRVNIINFCGEDDYYPVVTAIYAPKPDSFDKVRFLVESCDADVALPDSTGLTPLMIACEFQDERLVRYLLEHGANTTINEEHHSITALSNAVGDDLFDDINIPNEEEGVQEIVLRIVKLLVSHGAHIYEVKEEIPKYWPDIEYNRHVNIAVIRGFQSVLRYFYEQLVSKNYPFISKFIDCVTGQALVSCRLAIYEEFVIHSDPGNINLRSNIEKLITSSKEEVTSRLYKLASAVHNQKFALILKKQAEFLIKKTSFILVSFFKKFENYGIEGVNIIISDYLGTEEIDIFMKKYKKAQVVDRVIKNLECNGNILVDEVSLESITARFTDLSIESIKLDIERFLNENRYGIYDNYRYYISSRRYNGSSTDNNLTMTKIRILVNLYSINFEILDLGGNSFFFTPQQHHSSHTTIRLLNTGSGFISIINQSREISSMQLSAAAVEEDALDINSSLFDYKMIEDIVCNDSEKASEAQILEQPFLSLNASTSVAPIIEESQYQEPSYMQLSAAAVNTSIPLTDALPIPGEDFLREINLEFFSTI